MDEVWKDIKGFEGIYQISNMGRIISLKSGTPYILSNKNSKGDYLSVILSHNNNKRYVRIHKLVYEAFIGEIPNYLKYNIHHIDHNKQNNRYDNLILLSVKEHHLIHSTINPNIINGMVNYNKYIRPKKYANMLWMVLSYDALIMHTMQVCPRVYAKETYYKLLI